MNKFQPAGDAPHELEKMRLSFNGPSLFAEIFLGFALTLGQVEIVEFHIEEIEGCIHEAVMTEDMYNVLVIAIAERVDGLNEFAHV
jgi:hypothetical protein